MGTFIYKYGLAVIRDNSLLLCKPYAFDDLIVPGGTKENGEGALENLKREITEELGQSAVLDEQSLRYLGNFSDRAAGKSERVVEIELYAGEVKGPLIASSEIKELVWFDPNDPGSHKLSDVVRRKILPFLGQVGLLRVPH
jgi:8-oxo-dGTP pyrophosphatase MutT (NUDIX family)